VLDEAGRVYSSNPMKSRVFSRGTRRDKCAEGSRVKPVTLVALLRISITFESSSRGIFYLLLESCKLRCKFKVALGILHKGVALQRRLQLSKAIGHHIFGEIF
jgi:hypothetical protein